MAHCLLLVLFLAICLLFGEIGSSIFILVGLGPLVMQKLLETEFHLSTFASKSQVKSFLHMFGSIGRLVNHQMECLTRLNYIWYRFMIYYLSQNPLTCRSQQYLVLRLLQQLLMKSFRSNLPIVLLSLVIFRKTF